MLNPACLNCTESYLDAANGYVNVSAAAVFTDAVLEVWRRKETDESYSISGAEIQQGDSFWLNKYAGNVPLKWKWSPITFPHNKPEFLSIVLGGLSFHLSVSSQ